jgi:hypothetical protein
MLWFPPVSALVVKVACPPATVPVPSGFVPSRNCTVPVAAPAPGGPLLVVTVAVKVTGCPNAEGFMLLVSDNDEPAAAKTVAAPELLPLKLESPG